MTVGVEGKHDDTNHETQAGDEDEATEVHPQSAEQSEKGTTYSTPIALPWSFNTVTDSKVCK